MAVRRLPSLRSVTLTVTERCNLRCSYCYVPADRGRVMSAEVADAAVDAFAAHADDEGGLSLSFFGGEPFLATRLVARAIERARAKVRDGAALRVVMPTNGLLLDEAARALCRDERIELAISVDGDARSTTRPFAGGAPSAPKLLEMLPALLDLEPRAKLIARMTVTPANVDELASNVRALARRGFRRIVFLPAFEEDWTDEAIALWEREHRRLATWIVGARSAGRRLAELPTLSGLEARLTRSTPRRACGAGERLAAVATDGRVFPCYRFVFDDALAEFQIGDVRDGSWNAEVLARFAGLDPEQARPEHGSCRTCASRDGCTHFCPALGALRLGDPRGVPEVACRLMRASVEAIRASVSRARPAPRKAGVSWAAATALVVGAIASTGAACGGKVEGPSGDGDAGYDAPGPGVCAVRPDSSTDGASPGICPVYDAGTDAGVIGPGVCDYADTGVPLDAPPAFDAGNGPGICPAVVDSDAPDDGYAPGLCTTPADTGPTPGLC